MQKYRTFGQLFSNGIGTFRGEYEVYLASEADARIAELEAKIAKLKESTCSACGCNRGQHLELCPGEADA